MQLSRNAIDHLAAKVIGNPVYGDLANDLMQAKIDIGELERKCDRYESQLKANGITPAQAASNVTPMNWRKS